MSNASSASTIKINGGGPLTGETFYATKDSNGDGQAILVLDENPFPDSLKEPIFVFSCATGCMIMNGMETDLLRVDASDLAKLWF